MLISIFEFQLRIDEEPIESSKVLPSYPNCKNDIEDICNEIEDDIRTKTREEGRQIIYTYSSYTSST